MPLEFVAGDMFATKGLTHIAHGVNLCAVFGAGIAGQIARSRPWSRIDYMKWQFNARLGDIFISKPPDFVSAVSKIPSAEAAIIHMATQLYPGADARIDAIEKCFTSLLKELSNQKEEVILALPQIGCGLGGLEWEDVKPLYTKILSTAPFRIIVFETYIKGKSFKVKP